MIQQCECFARLMELLILAGNQNSYHEDKPNTMQSFNDGFQSFFTLKEEEEHTEQEHEEFQYVSRTEEKGNGAGPPN